MVGTGIRRFGGDCYAYGLLASDTATSWSNAGLQPYDYMALVPVIRGAGGVVSDWNGEELTLRSDGRVWPLRRPNSTRRHWIFSGHPDRHR